MEDEKIKVRITESDQVIEVVVLSKRMERIEVVLGTGIHNVRCELLPTRNGKAYSGSVKGRELVYERTPGQVKEDIDRLNPEPHRFRRR
jgi:hypothetical protein